MQASSIVKWLMFYFKTSPQNIMFICYNCPDLDALKNLYKYTKNALMPCMVVYSIFGKYKYIIIINLMIPRVVLSIVKKKLTLKNYLKSHKKYLKTKKM